MMNNSNPICCPIDRADYEEALKLAKSVAPHVGMLKLGLEWFCANGPRGLNDMASLGLPLFLDLKLHDIPNTIGGAMRAISQLPVSMVTIHASGGRAMIDAALAARHAGGPRILGVTVLTSLDRFDLGDLGIVREPDAQALELARIALESGCDGIVCSPLELAGMREAFGSDVLLVVPGIRPPGIDDDQKRTLTPDEAIRQGADWIVVGRPITAAADPASAAASLASAIAPSLS